METNFKGSNMYKSCARANWKEFDYMGRIELDIQWNLYLGDTLRVVASVPE